ncbi:MAG TPA: hypothetical protein VN408_32610 [Actinoplanes sp.]|nr:hypothetical protein [Actinoplanes sp.]
MVVTVAPAAAADSTIGGTITRSEALARAENWYSRRDDSDMGYSMELKTWDGDRTRQYRRDCSGLVDMAWHLGDDPNTGGLVNSRVTKQITHKQLMPGDALVDTTDSESGYPFHALLFGGWENTEKTRFWYYSFSGVSSGLVKRTGGSFANAELSGHPTDEYIPRRYHKIVNDVPEPDPIPHGTVYARSRSAAGTWENSATRTDTNTAISGIAATRQQTDNSLHVFTVVPGSGIWHRKAWEADATRIDSNPEVNDVAAAGLPNGTLHVFANVPGSGVWHRIRQTNGTWTDATRVDTNGGIYDIAATGLPDGTVHLQTLVEGAGVYDRARTAAGSWATGATRIDTNETINAIASAALPDGSLHIFTAVPGSGVWHRKAWEASATRIDTNASVNAISAAGLADGTLQLDVTVDRSGVWHRSRSAAGTWESNATHVDTNGEIFSTYTVGLNDNSVHVGTNVDLS